MVPTGDATICAEVGNPCGELKYQEAATGLFLAPLNVPNGVVIVVVVELKNWAWAVAVAAAGVGIGNVQGRRIDLAFIAPTDWLLLLPPVDGSGGGVGTTGLLPLPPIGPYLPFTANSNGTNSSGSANIESDLHKTEVDIYYIIPNTY